MIDRRIFGKALSMLPILGPQAAKDAAMSLTTADPVKLVTGAILHEGGTAESEDWSPSGSDDYYSPIRKAYDQGKISIEQVYAAANKTIAKRPQLTSFDLDLLVNKSMSYAAKVYIQRQRLVEREVQRLLVMDREPGTVTENLREYAREILGLNKRIPPNNSKGANGPARL